MITTGITRKIDELGRIVLPKEIRKTLNINTGDDFQISIENEKIILQRYLKLKNKEKEILKLLDSFIKVYNFKIYMIIGNKDITTNTNIKETLTNIIQERKMYIQENISKFQILENITEEGRVVINPIVKDSDLLGTLVIISNNKINELIDISKIISCLVKDIIDSK